MDFETDHITNSTHLIMIKLITPLLLVIATLVTSATAKSYNIKEFTQSYKLSTSVLYAHFEGKGSIESTFLMDADLESAPGVSLEWSTLPSWSGFSVGFEYVYLTTGAQIGRTMDSSEADVANFLTGSTSFTAENYSTLDEDYNLHTAFLNFSNDTSFTDNLSAYIGLGLGFCYINQEFTASSDGSTFKYDEDDIVFTYQVKAGMQYNISDSLALNGGVRFMGLQDAKFDYNLVKLKGNAKVFAVELGLAYKY